MVIRPGPASVMSLQHTVSDEFKKEAEKLLNRAGSDPTGYIGRLTRDEESTLKQFRDLVNEVG